MERYKPASWLSRPGEHRRAAGTALHLLVLAQNNVITPRSGGALRVAGLFREFIETGHEVTVIRFRKPGEIPSDLGTGVSVYDMIVPSAHDLAPVAALTHLFS